jgi:hypothetical protein
MGKSKELKNIEPVEESAEVFENDIELYLNCFIEDNNINDLKKEPQGVWNAALIYINKHVFKNKDILKDSTNIPNYNNTMTSNYNRYNYSLLDNICDIYIYLCYLYDKEVSIMGFSKLTGINYSVIQEWGHNYNNSVKLSRLSIEIYKKLIKENEESLSALLVTGKRNAVGLLGALNKRHGWNLPGVSKEKPVVTSISVEQMQALEDIKSKTNAD